jgi:hypothetical protein
MTTHPHIRHEQLRPARRHTVAVGVAIVVLLTLPAACHDGLLDDTPTEARP